MKHTYTNPRKSYTVDDWPWGSKLKTQARFWVEANAKGERVHRVLDDPRTGRPCAPKTLTYAHRMVIVDGDDGRTYIVADAGHWGHFTVWQANMQYNEETISKDAPEAAALKELFT